MRALGFKDVFAVSRILKKMDIRIEFQKGMSESQMGTMFIQSFIENVGSAEKEVTELLADLKGLKNAEVEKLSLDETFDLIMEFKEMPGLQSFFTRVSSLMK